MTSMTKLFVPSIPRGALPPAPPAKPAGSPPPASSLRLSMALVVSLAVAAIAGPAAAQPADDARKQCTAAMNADPKFAAEIVRIADETAAQKRDADTVAAHKDAEYHIQKNERHVIYAYAAMWIVAAGFVIFLWRRQQALTAEILQLRRELDAATDGKPAEGRS